MGYRLEGRLLEVCNCKVLCPCWVGEDPDNGVCEAALAYRFDQGVIDGVDVSGLTLALVCHIPGNVLEGRWRVVLFVDENATPDQEAALLRVYGGQAGGPVAELAQLVGEVVAVRRVPIEFAVVRGGGVLKIGATVAAELEPYVGPTGKPTTLVESIFSTIPGSPAYVGKAKSYRRHSPELGADIDLAGNNAIQGHFLFEHAV
jgi:hypothetical protein